MCENVGRVYTVFYSMDDKEWVGVCREYPSLSHLAETSSKALRGIKVLVATVDADPDLQEQIIETANYRQGDKVLVTHHGTIVTLFGSGRPDEAAVFLPGIGVTLVPFCRMSRGV